MTQNKSWTVELEEDGEGNMILPIPEELIDDLGWLIDDILDMNIDEESGNIIVTNITCNERKDKADVAK